MPVPVFCFIQNFLFSFAIMFVDWTGGGYFYKYMYILSSTNPVN